MYPTAFIGLVLVAVAIQYARDPRARYRHIARTLAVLTGFSSMLGFTTGVLKTFLSAGGNTGAPAGDIALIGVGESLHNIALGLAILVCAWIAIAIGTARTPSGSATVADTHAP